MSARDPITRLPVAEAKELLVGRRHTFALSSAAWRHQAEGVTTIRAR